MCAHTQAQAEEAKRLIADLLQPQIDAIAANQRDLTDLSNFYHCESEKFKIMSEFASQFNINGAPIDGGQFAKYSDKLTLSADICEGYADYLDILMLALENEMNAQQAIEAAANTDCWACVLAAMEYYSSGNS